MARGMFGYRKRSSQTAGARPPGLPQGQGYPEPQSKSKDGPAGYEGKEHVKYKDPGHTRHKIRIPEDEPHMKSHASKEEMHEMEDNYHMDVPDQTPDSLPAQIKRARMKMDAPDQEDPKPILGTPVHNVPYRGEEDTTGEEEMGPNDMQGSESKERRKKMIAAVVKRKARKGRDEGRKKKFEAMSAV